VLGAAATRALALKLVHGMVERKRGGILNIATIVGFQPIPYWTTYAATKAFVLSFGAMFHPRATSSRA
jgi:short-subunit dehydrogenase